MRATWGFGGGRSRWANRLPFLMLVALTLFVGCAAPPPRTTGQSQPAAERAVAPPKTLRLATHREPAWGIAPPGGTQFGDRTSVAFIFHAGLTIYDQQGAIQPHLATKVPSLDDGDWVVLADGRMEVTWKLRPNVKWHDGEPLTAQDFVFGVQVVQDPEVPLFRGQANPSLADAVALDPHTLVIRWKEPNFEANTSDPMDIPAIPARLVGDLFEKRDMQAFVNSPYWGQVFIGLGPYRLTQWMLGSHIEAAAFDDYFLGRPKIDRLVIRNYTDLNTMVANILAGEIDLIVAGTIKIEEAMLIRQAWEPINGGTVMQSRAEIESIRIQHRFPNAPWASDVRVRRALAHFTDRQALVDALLYGTTTVAHAFAATNDPAYELLERRGFPRYAYDPGAGERLLSEAGWTRSGDAMVNAAGERFTIDYRVVANSEYNTRHGLAITDQWKTARLNPTLTVIPGTASNREELKATANGVYWVPNTLTPRVLEAFTTAVTSSEASRWRGQNYGAYSNPGYDAAYESFEKTLRVDQRNELKERLLRILANDVPIIPTLYAVNYATAFRTGVRGPTPLNAVQLVTSWNIHTWEVD
jgi:peptide/nickel transport system substrate-binding protein